MLGAGQDALRFFRDLKRTDILLHSFASVRLRKAIQGVQMVSQVVLCPAHRFHMAQKLLVLLALHVRAQRCKPQLFLCLGPCEPLAHCMQYQHARRERGHQPQQRRAKVCLVIGNFRSKISHCKI